MHKKINFYFNLFLHLKPFNPLKCKDIVKFYSL